MNLNRVYDDMPEWAQERVDAAPGGWWALLVALWANLDDGPDAYRPTPTHAEETVTLALTGKLGTEIQALADRRIEAFKKIVQLFPAEAKAKDPAAYWRLVNGTMRAIWRFNAVKNGDISRDFVRGLWRKREVGNLDDGFDDMHDPYAGQAELAFAGGAP